MKILDAALSELQSSKLTGNDAIVIVRWGSQEFPVWSTMIDGNGILQIDLDGRVKAGECCPLTKEFLTAILKDANVRDRFEINLPNDKGLRLITDCWILCLGGLVKLDCDMDD